MKKRNVFIGYLVLLLLVADLCGLCIDTPP